MPEKFYITTAIAYASRKPHIGNTYDPVLADSIARYKRMRGFDVYYLTGTDEHGQKIEEAAREKGVSPKDYVDAVAAEVKAVWDCLNISYDRFIRTTDPDHEAAIKAIFKKLYDQDDIYKSAYEGKYCVPCESFFTASQLRDGKCPDCGREVTDAKEEAYFLRLSKYQDRLAAYYENTPDFFQPASRKTEMVNNFLKPGLSDLCVSRTSFTWGIPVEFDPQHVVYVWLDALSNYITGIGYNPNGSSPQYEKYWPADLHVIGKDIVRFHTVYWPIILMALGEELPRQVLGHPWLLSGEEKMSKSRGNVLYADELAARFGTDAVRYYLLSEIPFASDGTITYASFIAKYNTDLANTIGNLVNRSAAMANKYFGGKVTRPEVSEDIDEELEKAAAAAVRDYITAMDAYHNADAADVIMDLARRLNKYIDETAPWTLAKDDAAKPRLNAVLYHLLNGIRVLAVLLTPFIPASTAEMQKQTGTEGAGFEDLKDGPDAFQVGNAAPLFARIDAEKVLEEIRNEAQRSCAKFGIRNDEVPAITFLDQINIEDFGKIDLRAAKIIACEPVPRAKKLLKLTLDDGSGVPRTVCSGIAPWYTPEQLIGHTVILVANLKPAALCGVESQGMILAADAEKEDGGEDVKVIFVDGLKPGSKVR